MANLFTSAVLLALFVSALAALASAETMGRALHFSKTQMLQLHNQARREYGVRPLKWSSALARYSQRWANACHQSDYLVRKGGSTFWLSNFAGGSHGAYSPKQLFCLWYKEKSHWTCGRNYNACHGIPECGHYTQLMDQRNTHVGCGLAHCGSWDNLFCGFAPGGNFNGKAPFPARKCHKVAAGPKC